MENLEHLKNWHFLRHYHHYSHESWYSGSLWQAFQGMPVKLTFRQGQRKWYKILESLEHWHYVIYYPHCSHESWQDGILLQYLSEHINLGDLYPRSRSLGRVEIIKTLLLAFMTTMTTTAFQNTPFWVTFSQGQGHKVHHLLAFCRGQGKNKLKRFDISGSVYSFAVHDLCDLDACWRSSEWAKVLEDHTTTW